MKTGLLPAMSPLQGFLIHRAFSQGFALGYNYVAPLGLWIYLKLEFSPLGNVFLSCLPPCMTTI